MHPARYIPKRGFPGIKRSSFVSLGLKRSACGFTLAELLIALAILGVIATFTIPKVLQAQQADKRRAVFKETFAALSQAMYMGVLTHEINNDVYFGPTCNEGTYLRSHLNAVKVCNTDSSAEGCFDPAMGLSWEGSEPGIIMHNGAYVYGINNACTGNGFAIDWNGPAGPNIEGDDEMDLFICTDLNGCSPNDRRLIGPYTTDSETLYESIFK